MRIKRQWVAIGLAVLTALALGTPAGATSTVATFADPSGGAGNFLFTYTDTSNNGVLDGTLTGGFLGSGLNLLIGGVSHPNTHFTFSPLQGTGAVDLNGLAMTPVSGTGLVDFSDSGGDSLLIDFDVAHLTLTDVGASDIIGDNVNIRFPASDPFAAPESFAFSFANGTVASGTLANILAGNAGQIAWTAAFTSSATVPEPGTLMLLSSGLIGLGTVARWRARK